MLGFKVCIWILILRLSGFVQGQSTRVRCYQPTGMNDFSFVFRFDREMDTSITKLAFFDSSDPGPTEDDSAIDSPSQCQTTTVSNNVLTVGFDVSATSANPCGITKSGTVYTITVGSIGTATHLYRFQCDTTSLAPNKVDITTFDTGNVVPRLSFRTNKQHLRFHVVQAGGNKVPALEAQLGLQLILRTIYDKDFRNHRNNLGSVFHIPFMEQDNSLLFLRIMTPGTGTVVRVSGKLPGSEFSTLYAVKRDLETEVNIPGAYRHAAVGTAWETSKRAIKVETVMPNEFFSVRVTTAHPSNPFLLGAFMSLPDNILGITYNCYTGSDLPQGQIQVYATQDSTTLTLNLANLPFVMLTINGVPVTVPVPTVSMDDYDVLNIRCGPFCSLITLISDKPVGVVGGHERQRIEGGDIFRSLFVSQVAPINTYGKIFILSAPFRYQLLSSDPSGMVTYTKATTGTSVTVTSGSYITDVTLREEYRFNENVLVLASLNDSALFTMPWPANHQWALRYYIFMEQPEFYTVLIVARTGDIEQIEYRDSGITDINVNKLGDIPGLSLATVNVLSGTPTHQWFVTQINIVTGKGPALVEFKAGPSNRPFQLHYRTRDSNQARTFFLPVGYRYGITNPCVNSTADPNIMFGEKIQTFPGDGIDNDCDGFVDEETNDNTDNDGDGAVDEDLAPNKPSPHTGIYVDTLKASNNAQFSNAGNDVTVDLITNGCSASASPIQPFRWNRNIGEMFDSFHIVDTPSFSAFYIWTPRIYFRVTVGFCVGNLTGSKCDMSCQSSPGRKRREADEFVSMDTSLEITNIHEEDKNIDHSATEMQFVVARQRGVKQAGYKRPEDACAKTAPYWIPPVLLLLTIVVECGVIVAFVICRLNLSENHSKLF